MVRTILMTRPNHDPITSYLHDFSRETLEVAKGTRDIHVSNLEGSRATRENLVATVNKESPSLLFLNGHGDRKRVAGHKDEVILDEMNIELSKNRIVYALSCDSLSELGRIAVEKGAKAYLGYAASFMIIRDPSRECNPGKDKNALPFKEACVTLINSLLFGSNVGTAINRTKQKYVQLIRSYGTSEDDPYGDVPLIRFALSWNYTFLGMEGNPDSSI